MQDIVDLLQIKIEKAKAGLPAETLNAIAAVDWRAAILGMRASKGYTFEQLGDLELETELLLCGLVPPADYPKELSSRMKISGAQANELVNEMNELVFAKIRAELVKNAQRKRVFAGRENTPTPERVGVPTENVGKNDMQVLSSAGIKVVPATNIDVNAEKPVENREDILKKVENPELIAKEEVHSILKQKLSGSFQAPIVKTEHTIENISKTSPAPAQNGTIPKKPIDPYREIPE